MSWKFFNDLFLLDASNIKMSSPCFGANLIKSWKYIIFIKKKKKPAVLAVLEITLKEALL